MLAKTALFVDMEQHWNWHYNYFNSNPCWLFLNHVWIRIKNPCFVNILLCFATKYDFFQNWGNSKTFGTQHRLNKSTFWLLCSVFRFSCQRITTITLFENIKNDTTTIVISMLMLRVYGGMTHLLCLIFPLLRQMSIVRSSLFKLLVNLAKKHASSNLSSQRVSKFFFVGGCQGVVSAMLDCWIVSKLNVVNQIIGRRIKFLCHYRLQA